MFTMFMLISVVFFVGVLIFNTYILSHPSGCDCETCFVSDASSKNRPIRGVLSDLGSANELAKPVSTSISTSATTSAAPMTFKDRLAKIDEVTADIDKTREEFGIPLENGSIMAREERDRRERMERVRAAAAERASHSQHS